jgi:hypothetical protein
VVCIGVVDIELLFCNLVDPNCAPSASHDCCAVVGCEIGWEGAAAVCCSRQGQQANNKDIAESGRLACVLRASEVCVTARASRTGEVYTSTFEGMGTNKRQNTFRQRMHANIPSWEAAETLDSTLLHTCTLSTGAG